MGTSSIPYCICVGWTPAAVCYLGLSLGMWRWRPGQKTPANPSQIFGSNLWYRADAGVYHDAGTTLAIDGQTVQQWNDQSGNGNNLSQASAGSRPQFLVAGYNSKPTVQFSGTDAEHLR
jgi:hypothetical protein